MAAAIAAIYAVPYAGYALYPLLLTATVLHELAHALAALVTGGEVGAIALAPDGGAATVHDGGAIAVIAAAGPLAPALIGAALVAVADRPRARRGVLLGLAAAVVIIASLRALRLHGGVKPDQVSQPDLAAVQAGLPNLLRHLENARHFGRPVVIALNAFTGDSDEETAAVRAAVEAADVGFAVIDAPNRGAEGGVALAQVVLDTLARHGKAPARTLYTGAEPLRAKIERIATAIYRATSVVLTDEAAAQLAELEAAGHGHLPVCMAKTPASFTDDPSRPGAPDGHTLTVRRFELAAGAGFVVALCGAIVRMPGLPKEPRALAIDLVDGQIVGVG